ncbi:hypothetical protein KUCAC02_010536 [Chaenocephalus aceratus]|uniref:Uncharacterized protein n=1 Tax=Chaenocephalus aceratus TaxID=36190 RepID=A0ACB9W047_CHAAC|nr:hypothetical protein KUCAC02_010536 [Chaenocephalus aceratus]
MSCGHYIKFSTLHGDKTCVRNARLSEPGICMVSRAREDRLNGKRPWNSAALELSGLGTQRPWNSAALELSGLGTQRPWNTLELAECRIPSGESELLYLREPACLCLLRDTDDEDSFRDIEIGILLIEHEGASPSSSLHRSPASLKIIILEGQVVIDNIQDLPKAISVWSYIYALHLNYPKTMMLTFQFIQKVLLTLGQDELKPRLQTLKNQLPM